MALQGIEIGREVTGYHQMSAASLVASTPVPGVGSVVMIQAEIAPVRYRPDGVDPTSLIGVNLAVGESHTLNVGHGNINKIRVIRVSPGAVVNITAFK
jgi:hypothetical protein